MKLEFSAGGIVFRRVRSKIHILVAQHSQHHGWVFPKGLIDKKETKEEAALREVQEETGITGNILMSLTPVTYWYQFDGEKRKKTVYYFLMDYVLGDTQNHDHEMENVEWLPVEEVDKRLTYKSDKEVWKRARNLILRRDVRVV